MAPIRLTVIISICLLFCTGCKNNDGNSPDKVDRSSLVAAMKQFKIALNAKSPDSLRTFLSQQIIQDNNFGTEDINICKGFFEHLDIDRLKTSDSISRKIAKREDPCLTIFAMGVAADSLTFLYTMDQNPDYKVTVKDIAEDLDQSSLCEHIMWFNFKMIRGQLKLTSLGGAD